MMGKMMIVNAVSDKDGDVWYCAAVDTNPSLRGLFAWGPSFGEARRGLAAIVAVALRSAIAAWEPISAIRVVAFTRKTFALNELGSGSA